MVEVNKAEAHSQEHALDYEDVSNKSDYSPDKDDFLMQLEW